MPLKLISITFEHAPKIPGVRSGDMTTVNCYEPSDALRNWRVIMRGPSLFFVSPAGWWPGRNPSEFDPKGPCRVHEVPRASCYLHWTGSDSDIDAVIVKGKFESPPFAREPEPTPAPERILDKLDPSQLGDA